MANDISKDLQQICKVLSALNTNVLGLVRETKRQNDTLDEMAEILTEVRDILDDFELEEIEEERGDIDPNYTTYKIGGGNPYEEH